MAWNPLIGIGFASLGVGYLWEWLKGRHPEAPPTPLGVSGLGRPTAGMRTAMPWAAVSGGVGAPPPLPYVQQGKRVATAGRYSGIRALQMHPAGNIMSRVGFIQNQIRKDSLDKQVISEARMLVSGRCPTVRGGVDWCLPVGTGIIRRPWEPVPVEQIEAGDEILGDGAWTRVVSTFQTGEKPVLSFRLNNGSVLRCTAEHRLLVVQRRTRKDRGNRVIPHGSRRPHESFPGLRTDVVEVRAGEIRVGDELLQPESLPFGEKSVGSDKAFLMGAYAAEGWLEPSRASIAGVPGGKGIRERVVEIASRLGIPFSTDAFKVRLNDRAVVRWLSALGCRAGEKHLPDLDLDEESVRAVLDGLNADASVPGRGVSPCKTPTFFSTSARLAWQYRMLQRMLGNSASMNLEPSKGEGFAPLWKVHVRGQDRTRGAKVWARVEAIEAGPAETTFDLETESGRIYLPDCDVVVHNCIPVKNWRAEVAQVFNAVTNPNSPMAVRYTRDHAKVDLFASSALMRRLNAEDCDGMMIRVGALLRAIGYSIRLRVVAPKDQPGVWAHIYIMVGTPPGEDKTWLALDVTEAQNGPFWEVPGSLISSKKDFDV